MRSKPGRIRVYHKSLKEEVFIDPMKYNCQTCNPDMSLLAQQVIYLEAENDRLKAELLKAKNLTQKPKFRDGKLSKEENKPKTKKKRRGGKQKFSPTPNGPVKQEKEVIICEPENLPPGAEPNGHRDYVVKEIEIVAKRVVYRLKQYIHNGKTYRAKVPTHVKGHFGNQLKAFILFLNHTLHATQPKIKECLDALGIKISAGGINNILTEKLGLFHAEAKDVLSIGLEHSKYIQVDDTGAFHRGKNFICTVIGNEHFTFLKTTKSKSRLQFLTTLSGNNIEFLLNSEALAYSLSKGVSRSIISVLSDRRFKEQDDLVRYLNNQNVTGEDTVRTITEGALLAAIKKRYNKDLIIISDEAPQFDVFIRALCWIHAERHFRKLVSIDEKMDKEVESYRDKIWKFYKLLKRYKRHPSNIRKNRLARLFDSIFNIKSNYPPLADAINNFTNKKNELLVVLQHHFIPLHNNTSENHIRDSVIRRKVSPTTMSIDGLQARDTFLSIKKTCKNLGINFFAFLYDRLQQSEHIPNLGHTLQIKLNSS